MEYKNPIILSDYSDPDCIRYKNSYYMVSSSFNHTPILPILKSENLVNWKLLRYVDDKIPFERFNEVCHGDGVWAPSIRYHNGMFYIICPYPDEGIYIYRTNDIEKGKFECNLLIDAKGIIDPCPIWYQDKCYLVVGFAKSRIGFNSCLGLYEVSPDLRENISKDYKIIFDGHNTAPTIEGPKFYYRNNMFYILAPAGSVKTGWQVALRSKNVYGPYEQKIVMLQNDSIINGPHQGALVDIDENKDVFIHFQDLKAYGRIVHLEPVKWVNDWPLIGNVKDDLLGGSPILVSEYPIDLKSNYKIKTSDSLKNKISLIWQTPANKNEKAYEITKDGLKLNMINGNYKSLNMLPTSFLTKIIYKSFSVCVDLDINLINDFDESGLCYMGYDYAYISIKRINNKNYVILSDGKFNVEDNILDKIEYDSNHIKFNMRFITPGIYRLGYNGKYFKNKFEAKPGRWIGGKYGIFSRGNSFGYSIFSNFVVRELKYENK